MELNDTGIEFESSLDPRVDTLAELGEARRSLAVARGDETTVEDLLPSVIPAEGVIGLAVAIGVAVVVAGAVYAARSLLHG